MQFYIILIFSGLVFFRPVAAQSDAKQKERLVLKKQRAPQSYLNLDGAQVFSTFKFSTDNQDMTPADNLAYSYTTGRAFNLGYSYIKSNGLFVITGIGMRKAGSSMIYKNISYTWNIQYIDVKAGVGYQFNKWRLKPYTAIVPYYAYVLDAKQSIGTYDYDIKASNSIKNKDLGLFMALGFKVDLSPYFSIYSEYNYILGLQNIEATRDQYLYNRGFSVKLGIALNLTSFSASEKNIVNSPSSSIIEDPVLSTNTKNQPILNKENVYSSPTELTDNSVNEVPESDASLTNKTEKSEPVLKAPPDNTSHSSLSTDAPVSSVTGNEKKSTKSIENLELIKNPTKDVPNVSLSDSNHSVPEMPGKLDVSSLSKEKMEKTATVPNPDNIVFKIQIIAVKNPLRTSNSAFKNLVGTVEMERGKDDWIRYYIGSFKTYEEVRAELNKIKYEGGAEGGFVVAFNNGKQITVSDAKELTK